MARITVTHPGLQRLPYEALPSFPGPVEDPGRLQLSTRGRTVPFLWEDGGDGRFGPGDALLFHAPGMARDDPLYPYVPHPVYWLALGAGGRAMSTVQTAAGGAPLVSFRHRAHAEEDWAYWQQMPEGEGRDHWFWGPPLRPGETRELALSLPDPDPGGAAATVRVLLQGRTDVPGVDPDHRTELFLNGCLLGEVRWDGQRPREAAFQVPPTCLQEGSVLRVTERELPGVTVDGVYVDWVEVDYHRLPRAREGRLRLRLPAGQGVARVEAGGFGSPDVLVLEVTDPLAPRRVTGVRALPEAGGFRVAFGVERGPAERVFLLVERARAALPEAALVEPGYRLRRPGVGAREIVVAPPELEAAARALARHRNALGLPTVVALTRRIYDEFGGGLPTPHAIRAFLAYAFRQWHPRPEYVLLLGDASLDARDRYGTGVPNLVPTYLVETSQVGQTPSDHWLVTVAGDDPLPDLLVGRIPVRTPEQARAAVDKIVAYETEAGGAWQSRLLLAVGDQDPRFSRYLEEWRALVPGGYRTVALDTRQVQPRLLARERFSRALSADGAALVVYFGHGRVDRWVAADNDGVGRPLVLLSSEDVLRNLRNERAWPFFVALNCLNGLFAQPADGRPITTPDGRRLYYRTPLPEALLQVPGRGGIGMWAPAAFAYPSEQRHVGRRLFEGLFREGDRIMGSVTTRAKLRAYVEDGVHVENLHNFTLFGDPATRLRLAAAAGASASAPPAGGGGGGALGWAVPLLLAAGRTVRRLARGGGPGL